MRLWKKIVLTVLGMMVILVGAVCAKGIQMYSAANHTLDDVFVPLERKTKKREAEVNIDAQEPFSILLMGLDTGDFERTDQGRSDTTMVVTVNPAEKKSTMISLDRDILTEMVGYGTEDKLNHAYAFGGATMAVDTVSELLDLPIDHYVTINMKGLQDLIDAVGGIDVNNTVGEFELDGIIVPAGEIHLNGELGLAYARMRKEDPEGDIGRQKRQREVVEKILRKVLSLNGVTKYNAILDAVRANITTDLTWDDMIDIQKKYLAAFENIDSLQLQGEDTYINDIYYQILAPAELYKVQTALRAQLGLEPNEDAEVQDQENYNTYVNQSGFSSSYTGTEEGYGYGYSEPQGYTDYGTEGYSEPNGGGY